MWKIAVVDSVQNAGKLGIEGLGLVEAISNAMEREHDAACIGLLARNRAQGTAAKISNLAVAKLAKWRDTNEEQHVSRDAGRRRDCPVATNPRKL